MPCHLYLPSFKNSHEKNCTKVKYILSLNSNELPTYVGMKQQQKYSYSTIVYKNRKTLFSLKVQWGSEYQTSD